MNEFDPAKAHAGLAIEHGRQLTRARFSPCGKFVAAGGLDRAVHLWELESKAHTAFAGHASWIGALAFHPDKRRLFSADYHGAIRAWDYTAPDAPPLFTIAAAHPDAIRALAVTPDGALLLSAGDDAIERAWSTTDGKLAREFPGHDGPVFSLATHPGDGSFVTGDLRGAVRQWRADGTLARTLDAKLLHTRKEDFIADVGGVRSLAFNADGSRLAVGGLRDMESNTFCPGTPAVLVFDWNTGQAAPPLRMAQKADGPINGLRWLRDGTLVGACEHLNAPTQMSFWQPDKAPEPFHSFVGESAYDLDLHPDGLRLVAPHFVSKGSGGNGARDPHREKYIANAARIRVVNLWAAPSARAVEHSK